MPARVDATSRPSAAARAAGFADRSAAPCGSNEGRIARPSLTGPAQATVARRPAAATRRRRRACAHKISPKIANAGSVNQ